MSPRFASAITSSPAWRAELHVSSNARSPCEPSAAKKASCGLTATQNGAAASTRPRQKRATASPRDAGPAIASPCSSTGRRSSTGSSPSTSWVRRRSTASPSRSAKTAVFVSTCVIRSSSLGGAAARQLVEGHDAELGRRPPEELRDDQQLVGVLGRERRLSATRLREACVDLERRARCDRPRCSDASRRDEERSTEALLRSRGEEAQLGRAQPFEPLQLGGESLDGSNPVAKPRRVLVPQRVGVRGELAPQARERGAWPLELVRLERACGESGAAAALQRPVRRRLLRHDDRLAARAEVDVAIRPRRARVRGRPQLPQQPQLLERSLELGADDAPLDRLDGRERRLDRRTLPLGAEVRAQARAQVACATDVEHLP